MRAKRPKSPVTDKKRDSKEFRLSIIIHLELSFTPKKTLNEAKDISSKIVAHIKLEPEQLCKCIFI